MDGSSRQISIVKWPVIIVIVLLLLGGIQIYRVNRPRTDTGVPPPVTYTSGTVVDGVIDLPAGGFLQYKMNFNRRVRVTGRFKAGDIKQNFSTLLLTEENFEKWKAGTEYKSVAETGYLPGGKMIHTLQAGTYYVVFDNRKNPDSETKITANFTVE